MGISEYQQSLINTRETIDNITVDAQKAMLTASQDAWNDIDRLLRESTGGRNQLVIAKWQAQREALRQIITRLANELNVAIDSRIREVTQSVVDIRTEATLALMRDAGVELPLNFSAIPQESMMFIAQRGDVEGLRLDTTRWIDNHDSIINQEVLTSKARGESIFDLSKRLRPYVRGASDFTPEELADLRRIKDRTQRKLGRKIAWKAQLVARSETLNAAWEAGRRSAVNSPVVKGIKWRLSANHDGWDECDILATQDIYGLGKGVYPPERIPSRPHPNDRCWQEEILRDVSEWNQSRAVPDLTRDPEKIRVRGQGTKGYIAARRQKAVDLIKASSQGTQIK